MPLTNDILSLWELGHRMAGENPDRWRPRGVSLAVRDNFRLLLNEILHAHLESTLIIGKWNSDLDTTPDMHLRHHLETINDCIHRGDCPKRFLRSVGVERWEFRQWCQQAGTPLPDFWYGCEYQRPDEDEEDVMADAEGIQEGIANHPDKLRPSQRTRVACQEIAKVLWKDVPETTIAAMIEHEAIQRLGGGERYDEKTLRKWLFPVAPLGVREKRDRPGAEDNDE